MELFSNLESQLRSWAERILSTEEATAMGMRFRYEKGRGRPLPPEAVKRIINPPRPTGMLAEALAASKVAAARRFLESRP